MAKESTSELLLGNEVASAQGFTFLKSVTTLFWVGTREGASDFPLTPRGFLWQARVPGALKDVGGIQTTDLVFSVPGVKNCPSNKKDLNQHRCDSSSH